MLPSSFGSWAFDSRARAGVVAHICARVSDGVYGVGMIDEREDADKAMS